MKAIARLSFLILLVLGLGAAFIAGYAVIQEWLRALGAGNGALLVQTALWSVFVGSPVIIAAGVLSCFAYADRHGIKALPSALVAFVFCSLFLLFFCGIAPRFLKTPGPITGTVAQGRIEGFIVSRADGWTVLLDGTNAGPRLTIDPSRSGFETFEDVGSSSVPLAPEGASLFTQNVNLRSLTADSALIANRLYTTSTQAGLPFVTLTLAFVLLIISLRSLSSVSSWPLFNLTLTAGAIRGAFSFEAVLASGPLKGLVAGAIPSLPYEYAEAALLTGLAFLIVLASLAGWAVGSKDPLDA